MTPSIQVTALKIQSHPRFFKVIQTDSSQKIPPPMKDRLIASPIPHSLMVAALRFSPRASAASALRVFLLFWQSFGGSIRLNSTKKMYPTEPKAADLKLIKPN